MVESSEIYIVSTSSLSIYNHVQKKMGKIAQVKKKLKEMKYSNCSLVPSLFSKKFNFIVILLKIAKNQG